MWQLWLFWLAPLVGGALGRLDYRYLMAPATTVAVTDGAAA